MTNAGAEQVRLLSDVDFSHWLPEWLQPTWDFLATYPVVLVPVLVLLGYVAGKVLHTFISRGFRNLTARTSTSHDDQLIETVNKPVLPSMVILALLVGIGTMQLPEFAHNFTVRVLYTVLALIWTKAALRVTQITLEILSDFRHRFEIIQPRTIPAFSMALKILVVGIAAYILMLVWGVNPTAWLASAGVIGLAVGFAAKDTLANLFSGIFIVADAPYKIGDYVILDSGERGAITHLGMRSTRLLTRDDVEITIPNAVIANAKIINESGGPWEKERIRVPVGAAYGSDVDQVCDVLEQVAKEHREIIPDPAPRVRLRAFGTSSLDFELLGWIDHPELRGRVRHEILIEIYKAFAREGIEIPFPQQDVHVRSMPEPEG